MHRIAQHQVFTYRDGVPVDGYRGTELIIFLAIGRRKEGLLGPGGLALIKQNQHFTLQPHRWKMFEIIIELTAGDVIHEGRESLFRGVSLKIRNVPLCRIPDWLS